MLPARNVHGNSHCTGKAWLPSEPFRRPAWRPEPCLRHSLFRGAGSIACSTSLSAILVSALSRSQHSHHLAYLSSTRSFSRFFPSFLVNSHLFRITSTAQSSPLANKTQLHWFFTFRRHSLTVMSASTLGDLVTGCEVGSFDVGTSGSDAAGVGANDGARVPAMGALEGAFEGALVGALEVLGVAVGATEAASGPHSSDPSPSMSAESNLSSPTSAIAMMIVLVPVVDVLSTIKERRETA